MAATLLELVNRTRALLREEPISAIAANDIQTAALVEIVNGAKRRILDDHPWSFLVREDGTVSFPASVTGSVVFYSGGISFDVELDAAAGLVDALALGGNAWRLQVGAAASARPLLTYRILFAASTGGLRDVFTLQNYDGNAGTFPTAGWTGFTQEAALPETVSRVLSVRDENRPLQLSFAEQHLDIDAAMPNPLENTGGDIDRVVVGGTITNTAIALPATGMRIAVYPTSSVFRRIYFRYSYRFRDFSLAADTLLGVPNEISELIVRRAFIDCLMSNVQMDAQRGATMYLHLERDLQLALAVDVRDPLRRLIPTPFGERGLRLHPNWRWASRQVPAP